MRKYESIIVFEPGLSEERVEEGLEKVKGLLSANGGENIAVESWGKKDIPYVVRKQKSGHFRCVNFESENSEIVEKLLTHLRIAEGVIKYQTHRLNDRVRKFKGRPPSKDEENREQAAS